MSETEMRRFWQFGLTTALAMLLAASGMLWVNIVEHDGDDYYELGYLEKTLWYRKNPNSFPRDVGEAPRVRGWPCWFCERFEKSQFGELFSRPDPSFSWAGLAIDIVFALGIIVAIGGMYEFFRRGPPGWEWLIRRREGRKP